jgi:2-methylcitrate dehydratase PrpD
LTVTEQVVDFVRTATPAREALARAGAELDRFQRAGAAGADSAAVRALKRTRGFPGKPWVALLAGTAAAAATVSTGGSAAECAEGGAEWPLWVAVCAAADALRGDEAPRQGGRVAEAVAIGYVIADGAAAALGDSHTDAGWFLPTTAGTLGAAAAAGRMLGLSAEQLPHMLGICATQAAGLTVAEGTDAGALQVGMAASNAVEAALLSRNGFTSAARPLEGRRGLLALMSAAGDGAAMAGRLAEGWR